MKTTDSLIRAIVKADRSEAFIPLPNGKIIDIVDNDILSAYITKDRKHVVVSLLGGTIYVTNQNLDDKWIVTNNSNYDGLQIRNEGLTYRSDKEGANQAIVARVSFEDRSVVECTISYEADGFADYVVSENANTILYKDYISNAIYVLPSNQTDMIRIDSLESDVVSSHVRTVSDDGEVAIWSIYDGNAEKTVLYENGEKKVLDGYKTIKMSGDQKTIVLSDEENLWIKVRGKDIVSVKMNGATLSPFYTNGSRLELVPSSSITELYAITRGSDERYSLYRISLDGEKDRLLFKAKSISIESNQVAYVDAYDDLYVATIGSMELEEEKKIASDVYCALLAGSGKYVYYMKDVSRKEGTLYAYRMGDTAPIKIASQVLFVDRAYDMWGSEDGKALVFMKNVESADSFYYRSDEINGKLMQWHYGDESPIKIASDSIVCEESTKQYRSIACHVGENAYGDANTIGILTESDGFYYYRWNGSSWNYMYFTGRDSVKVATDVSRH